MLNLWHAGFVHADRRVIRHMAGIDLARGLELNEKVGLREYGPCVEATMVNGLMKSRTVVTSVPGTVIYTDFAEINVLSLDSAKYYVVIIDEDSVHVCAAHLKSKCDSASYKVKYVKWVERLAGNSVKRIVLDGGKGYLKAAKTLKSYGIDIDESVRYTIQKNGRPDRMTRSLNNSRRAVVINSEASANYWEECLYPVVDARNRYVRGGCWKTPCEFLIGVKPSVEHLRTFGYKV